MPVVAAAIVPHSPFLIPSIAKGNIVLAKATIEAVKQIGQEFHAAKIDEIIIVSPHIAIESKSHKFVTANSGEILSGDLKEFGDLTTSIKISPALELMHYFQNNVTSVGLEFKLVEQPLDYGIVVPMITMALINQPKLLALSVQNLMPEDVIRIGQTCYDVAMDSKKRIAIVASADLDRRETGQEKIWKPTAIEKSIAQAVEKMNIGDWASVANDNICGLKPITTLLAAVEGKNMTCKILSFEAPLRVGYLTAYLSI